MSGRPCDGCARFRGFAGLALLFLVWGAIGQPALGNEPIRIGVVGALTGPKSVYGEAHLQGIKIAVEVVNREGGIDGRPIEIIAVDDRGNSANVGALVVDLIYQKRVVAIIGSVDSACTHVISMVCVKAQVPHLTCVATDPSLTRAGSPWTFRTLADDERQTEAIASYIHQARRLKRICLLAADSRYGKMGALMLAARLRRLGIQVTGPLWIKESAAEALPLLRRELAAALASAPEAIVVWSLAAQGTTALQALNESSYRGLIMGGDGLATPAFYTASAALLEGLIVTSPYNESEENTPNQSFRRMYQERYSKNPDSFAAHAYDTIGFVIEALRKSDGSRESLRQELARGQTFVGATGNLQLDQTGNDIRSVRLAVVRNGKLVLLEERP
jgi:branched-chain amino acid transport system substrate-binding protein